MASLNNTTPLSFLKRPRVQVLTAGTVVPGLVHATMTSTNNFQCDTFELEFALWDDPKFGPSFFDVDQLDVDIQVSIAVGNQKDNFRSILLGTTDRINIRWFQGVATLTGRDKTSLFLDAKTNQTFQNLTSSQVIEQLILGHPGISGEIDVTTTKVGAYYAHSQTQNATGEFTKASTEWQLITFLAQQEGFDVWVKGNTLHFKQQILQDPTPWTINLAKPHHKPYEAVHLANVIKDIDLERNLSVAKDVKVILQSWNSNSGKVMTGQFGSASKTAQVFTRQAPPNMTQDALTKRANSLALEISKNERVISWREPAADDRFTPRNMVQIVNSGTSFDQMYYIQKITRTYSRDGGLEMDVSAKNHSVQSDSTESSVK